MSIGRTKCFPITKHYKKKIIIIDERIKAVSISSGRIFPFPFGKNSSCPFRAQLNSIGSMITRSMNFRDRYQNQEFLPLMDLVPGPVHRSVLIPVRRAEHFPLNSYRKSIPLFPSLDHRLVGYDARIQSSPNLNRQFTFYVR